MFDRRVTLSSPRVTELLDPRVRILRGRRVFLTEKVPPRAGGGALAHVALLQRARLPYLVVRDLDVDGEPDVMLTLERSRRPCCAWSRIYRYDAARTRYLATEIVWGSRADVPGVRDLNGDGRSELVGRDGRLAGFGEIRPVAVFVFASGRFERVTARYPAVVSRDAGRHWEAIRVRRASGFSIRSPLAAWVADQRLLGRAREGDVQVAELVRSGALAPQADDRPPLAPAAWVRALDRVLDRLGYPQE